MWQELLIYSGVIHAVNYTRVLLSCTKECVWHHPYTALWLPAASTVVPEHAHVCLSPRCSLLFKKKKKKGAHKFKEVECFTRKYKYIMRRKRTVFAVKIKYIQRKIPAPSHLSPVLTVTGNREDLLQSAHLCPRLTLILLHPSSCRHLDESLTMTEPPVKRSH